MGVGVGGQLWDEERSGQVDEEPHNREQDITRDAARDLSLKNLQLNLGFSS